MLPTQLVLDLWNKTLDKKVDFTEELVQKLTGDVRFTNPDPTLADVTTAVDAAHQALLDVANTKGAYTAAVEVQDLREKALVEIVTRLGNYIETTSGGDKTIIESLNLKTKEQGNASPLPPRVADVGLTQGDNQFEIDIHWHRISKLYNIQSFQIRYAIGDAVPSSWLTYDKTTRKSSITFVGTQENVRVWIEVRAVNATGDGPWSEVATIVIAPHT
ncbi:MAG: fibronectin type III domain-containing protein [Bacteroidetes bacterium]|nr:fibronectin type III domain-containing protein [Bacteroidota bacterium]